jgi:hypothetical protein
MAMMLGGLALVSFAAYRRRRNDSVSQQDEGKLMPA